MMRSSLSSSSLSPSPSPYAPVDSTFTSLHSLLSAPATSSAHLALLPPQALSSSLTLYLARLPRTTLPDFIHLLVTSRSLWSTPCIVREGGQGRIHEDVRATEAQGPQEPPSLLKRAYQIHLAAARAVFSRIDLLLILQRGDTGWRTQRKLRQWIDIVNENCSPPGESPATSRTIESGIPKLAILTGLLVGLTAYRQQSAAEKKRGLNVKSALSAAQSHWLASFSQVIRPAMPVAALGQQEGGVASREDEWESEFVQQAASPFTTNGLRNDLGPSQTLVPLYLAGQVASNLSDDFLSQLPLQEILATIPTAILHLYQPETFTISTEPSLRPVTPVTHALFPLLGPLSRLLSYAAEAIAKTSRPEEVSLLVSGKFLKTSSDHEGLVSTFVFTASQLQERFAQSGLATLDTRNLDDRSKANLTDIWAALKSFLFVTLQLYDGILDGLVETLPSPIFAMSRSDTQSDMGSVLQPSSNIPLHILQLLTLQLQGLMKLSFITFSLTNPAGSTDKGGEGDPSQITSNELYDKFTTYRHAFYGALEVVKTDSAASIYLVSRLSSDLPPLDDEGKLEPEWHPRAKVTLFLDACEQLVPSLPDRMIEEEVLQRCRPYLRDATYPGPFESAHSCVLAVFEAKKRVCKDLMPFYVESLIEAFPQHISPSQLSHALCTVLACLSDLDDALAYYVIERLEREISDIPTVEASQINEEEEKKQKKRGRLSFEPPSSSSSFLNAKLDGKDKVVERSRRLSLQLAYVDTLPFVNLVLLRSILSRVKEYILEAKTYNEIQHEVELDLEEEREDGKNANANAKMEIEKRGDEDEERMREKQEESSHIQLCQRTFKALNGMDDTARQEGVRWWLEHREEFGV